MSETFLILRRIGRDIIIYIQGVHVKCYHILIAPEFSQQILEKPLSNFMTTRPAVAQLFREDGQTDRQINIDTDITKLIFAVCSFVKGPKKKVMACCSQQTKCDRQSATDNISLSVSVFHRPLRYEILINLEQG